jgi:two-component system response regulator AlgR
MKIKAIIIDDERLARNRLRRLLAEMDVEVVAEGVDGTEAVKLAQSQAVDILFLDINMPHMNGLEAAREINRQMERPPSIIYCTAYDEYALEAFATNASAYVLKPANKDDLAEVIKQASRVSRLQANSNTLGAENPVTGTDLAEPSLILARQGGAESVPLANILFFRSIDKHVFAFIKQRGEVLVDYTLKELQSEFNDHMVRTHRCALVNKRFLLKLDKDDQGGACLTLRDTGQTIPVSRRHYSSVKKCFRT